MITRFPAKGPIVRTRLGHWVWIEVDKGDRQDLTAEAVIDDFRDSESDPEWTHLIDTPVLKARVDSAERIQVYIHQSLLESL